MGETPKTAAQTIYGYSIGIQASIRNDSVSGVIRHSLRTFLQFNDVEILEDKGKVTAAIAKAFAESEFEKYRVIQDRLYQSDFDRLMSEAENSDQ